VVVPSTGEVVLVPFPYTDLSQFKVRPAICVVNVGREDWILCQVTSKRFGDPRAVELAATDFASGKLRFTSYARPGKLFTASRSLILRSEGTLHDAAFQRVRDAIISLFRPGPVP
jgi:mRNA interferase MazF